MCKNSFPDVAKCRGFLSWINFVDCLSKRYCQKFFNIGAPYGATAGDYMADTNQEDEKVPFIQQLLDSPFILLFIGVMVPMVVYTLWGVIDILMIPVAK